MFFRRGVRNDHWLGAKMALFSVGALVAVVGMALRNDWVIGLAGLVLVAGIALRWVPRVGEDGEEPPPPG